ncbi:enoyl-CoA hydratase-related protein [Criibacterium bergeronii]|uniref:short-chain-enoyl-CoA hydratase n=1 Tax=Criibacterium bergeronii TaxID=1871336 RepID=A0A371IKV0_9FIRM|nr:enoyl-CoA hydratase-related protein [Criibacterium bergeronii]RDY21080.1 enoyl-CoA hydratase/isomerase family protein [Criibacterium bergeronii]
MNNLLMDVEGEIAVVSINRPKALNALNTETVQEINECFKEIQNRKDIKVVILTGAGEKSFVAGADIAQMSNMTPKEAREMSLNAYEAFSRIENCPQVVIAAVNGFALGGGCEIAMSCDIRIVADTAKFGQPEVGLGIIPGFGGTQRLPRLVGKGRAKELIFTAETIDANEAYRIGLVNKVVPKEELMDTCKKMAQRILKNGSLAITLAKQAINLGVEMDLNSGIQLESNQFGLTFSSQDQKEGMNAFLEKRKAELKDF